MKKLLTMLFTAVIAFSLAMPVFAQDTGTQEAPKTEKTKKAKPAKTHKAKPAKVTKEKAPATSQ